MTMVMPERSLQQRREALKGANAVRSQRHVLKRDLKLGHVDFVELLHDPPRWLETMKVFDLLIAVPGIGKVKANQYCIVCRISPSKSVLGLTHRQREELSNFMGTMTSRKMNRM